jgi:hypothetical protein
LFSPREFEPVHEVDPELDGLVVHLLHLGLELDLVNPEADTLESI